MVLIVISNLHFSFCSIKWPKRVTVFLCVLLKFLKSQFYDCRDRWPIHVLFLCCSMIITRWHTFVCNVSVQLPSRNLHLILSSNRCWIKISCQMLLIKNKSQCQKFEAQLKIFVGFWIFKLEWKWYHYLGGYFSWKYLFKDAKIDLILIL